MKKILYNRKYNHYERQCTRLEVLYKDQPNSHPAYVKTVDATTFIKGMIAANLCRGPVSGLAELIIGELRCSDNNISNRQSRSEVHSFITQSHFK